MMMKKTTILGILAIGFILDSGTARPAVKKKIEVNLLEKQVQNLTSSGLVLNFYVRIANLTASRYSLIKYDYRAVVEQAEYLLVETVLDEPISVEPHGGTLISLPIKITYTLLFQAVAGIESSSQLSCQVAGLMTFVDEKKKQERVPFALSGEFPVFQDPEIAFSPIRLKDLTLGGADLVVGFTIRNGNAFDLGAERVSYKLELAGRQVTQGTIREPSTWPAGSKKEFDLPLLLDFFEMGGELYPLLQQSAVEGRISGEIDADTVWGRLKIPIERKEMIPVSRTDQPDT